MELSLRIFLPLKNHGNVGLPSTPFFLLTIKKNIGCLLRVYKERKAKRNVRDFSILSYRKTLKLGHAPANLALTEQWFLITTAHFASQSKFLRKLVCIRTTFLMKSLSLRILSFKLRFACFQQVLTGSDYPSFRPIWWESRLDATSLSFLLDVKGVSKIPHFIHPLYLSTRYRRLCK